MKPTTEKRSEHGMRFFTPELFVQFNSKNDNEANQADDNWERAILQYKEHLAQHRFTMPLDVRKLAALSLHDAQLLNLDSDPEFSFPFIGLFCHVAILSLKQNNYITSLFYVLQNNLSEYSFSSDWPFSKNHVHWLYDEVDFSSSTTFTANRMFTHKILLSDGRVLEIPFSSVIINQFDLRSKDNLESVEHTAQIDK